MGNSFLTGDGPLKTVMIQVRTTKEALAEIQSGLSQGANAFGLQVECLLGQERTEANLKKIFAAGAGKPFYVTDYCLDQNEGKSYDEIAEELLFLARMGAALIDIPGDFYCKDPDQLTYDENAVKKAAKPDRRDTQVRRTSAHVVAHWRFPNGRLRARRGVRAKAKRRGHSQNSYFFA